MSNLIIVAWRHLWRRMALSAKCCLCGACSFSRVLWPMISGTQNHSTDPRVSFLSLIKKNRTLIPTVILPLCRMSIQQMPSMTISRILIQLLTLFDGLILFLTKFIHQHRFVGRMNTNALGADDFSCAEILQNRSPATLSTGHTSMDYSILFSRSENKR